MQKTYIAIDLKSFYASVELADRKYDPLTTNLVVADPTRTEKTICLAVSPSLKAYGISGRIAKSAVNELRKEGIKAGLIRPITVHPFPFKAYDRINWAINKGVLSIEMSIPAQFKTDVIAAVKGRCEVQDCLCSGGNIMTREAIITKAKKIVGV